MKCDICYKKPKCPSSAHCTLRYWIYYEKGEAKLSESGQKRFGKDYLEQLRNESTNTKMRILQ